jgi:hypothetical protein
MQWIKIEDELPQEGKDILISNGCEMWISEWRLLKQQNTFLGIEIMNIPITHWMYVTLPE